MNNLCDLWTLSSVLLPPGERGRLEPGGGGCRGSACSPDSPQPFQSIYLRTTQNGSHCTGNDCAGFPWQHGQCHAPISWCPCQVSSSLHLPRRTTSKTFSPGNTTQEGSSPIHYSRRNTYTCLSHSNDKDCNILFLALKSFSLTQSVSLSTTLLSALL